MSPKQDSGAGGVNEGAAPSSYDVSSGTGMASSRRSHAASAASSVLPSLKLDCVRNISLSELSDSMAVVILSELFPDENAPFCCWAAFL